MDLDSFFAFTKNPNIENGYIYEGQPFLDIFSQNHSSSNDYPEYQPTYMIDDENE
jgi:hypothetical protein